MADDPSLMAWRRVAPAIRHGDVFANDTADSSPPGDGRCFFLFVILCALSRHSHDGILCTGAIPSHTMLPAIFFFIFSRNFIFVVLLFWALFGLLLRLPLAAALSCFPRRLSPYRLINVLNFLTIFLVSFLGFCAFVLCFLSIISFHIIII